MSILLVVFVPCFSTEREDYVVVWIQVGRLEVGTSFCAASPVMGYLIEVSAKSRNILFIYFSNGYLRYEHPSVYTMNVTWIVAASLSFTKLTSLILNAYVSNLRWNNHGKTRRILCSFIERFLQSIIIKTGKVINSKSLGTSFFVDLLLINSKCVDL